MTGNEALESIDSWNNTQILVYIATEEERKRTERKCDEPQQDTDR